jgi:gliding motility-associated lipoprotein GldD
VKENKIQIGRLLLLLAVMVVGLSGCDDDEPLFSPKPKGYVRIDFPKKEYVVYDNNCPYSFEIPKYSKPVYDQRTGADPCWFNLQFPQFKATLHFSYKIVNNNLNEYLNDSHDFAIRHEIKATGIEQLPVIRDSARVYGLIFDIGGNTASSVQFYLTDSTKHFLRGALYFNSTPNIDSLKIVVDFIKQDIIHLVQTTHWKK